MATLAHTLGANTMAKMMTLKAFAPAAGIEAARMASTASKTHAAIALALRPCGVTAYEAAERINALGGQSYTPSYTKSAQFAASYYGPQGYGAYGNVETVGEHIAAVRAHAGDDDAQYARDALPESLRDDAAHVLVIYAYAAGGRAVGRYGQATLDDLPSTAEQAAERRVALTAARKGGKRGKRQARKRGSRK